MVLAFSWSLKRAESSPAATVTAPAGASEGPSSSAELPHTVTTGEFGADPDGGGTEVSVGVGAGELVGGSLAVGVGLALGVGDAGADDVGVELGEGAGAWGLHRRLWGCFLHHHLGAVRVAALRFAEVLRVGRCGPTATM